MHPHGPIFYIHRAGFAPSGRCITGWNGWVPEPSQSTPIGVASSPEGRAFGKTGRPCTRQPMSSKLFALAKTRAQHSNSHTNSAAGQRGLPLPGGAGVSGVMVRVIGFRMMGTRSRHTAGGCRAAGRSGACAAARQQAQAQAQSKKQREHTFHRFPHPFKIKDPLWPSVPPRLTSTCCQNGHRPGHFPHRVPLRIGLKHPSEVSAYKNHF